MTCPPGRPASVRWRLDCQKKRIARKRRARAIYNISIDSLIRDETKIINIFGVQVSPKISSDFDAGSGCQTKSFRDIRIEFENTIGTARNGYIELHISISICDGRPTYVYKIVLGIINMNGYITKQRFVIVYKPIPIRVDPGFCRTMPRTISNTANS